MAREATALLRDHERRLQMGRAGHEAWLARYSWDRVTDRYEELYRDVVAARAA
jgi:glycosyltransferase involved in cell wall biosynthesis